MAAILAATFDWKYICYCHHLRNYVTSRKIKPVSNMIKHKLSPNWCLLQTIFSNCALWLSNIVRILLLIWKKLYVDTMKNIFNWKWPPRWLPQGLRSVGVDGPYKDRPHPLTWGPEAAILAATFSWKYFSWCQHIIFFRSRVKFLQCLTIIMHSLRILFVKGIN